jgi:hypothetical protein
MLMMKFLLLIVIALVLWWVWKKRSEHGSSDAAKPKSKQPEAIVACVYCGVLHPVSDSVIEGSAHYCSAAHRLADRSSEKP